VATSAQIIGFAERVFEQYAARISRMLGIPVSDVMFKVGDTGTNVAETSGGVITLNKKWFSDNPNDAGAIAHELVHAFQQVPEGGAKDKRIEAFADAVRVKLGLTFAGWEPSAQAAKLAELDDERFRTASQKISGEGTLAGAGGGDQEKQVYQDAAGNYYIKDGVNVVRVTEEEAQQYMSEAGGDITFTPPTGKDGLTDEERRAKLVAERNARAFFLGQIGSLGIGLTPNLNQFVEQAINKGYSGDAFLYYLRQTPEYAKEFPGIFNKDGSMKMSEAQYISNVSQYESIAAQAGINLGPKQTAWLFQNDVSPAEYSIKAPAVARIKRDPQLYRAFGREVVQAGLAKPGETGLQGLLHFAAGLGNRAWMDLWQDTVTRNAAINAGIAIKRSGNAYAQIGQGLLERISGKGLSEDQMTAAFQDLAEHLVTTLPESEIQNMGLNPKQLVTAEFGGPGAAQIRQKVKRVAETYQAQFLPRAQPGLAQSAKGGLQTVGVEERAQGQ